MLKRNEKKIRTPFLVLPVLLLIAAGVWFFMVRYEGQLPEIQFDSFPKTIGSKSDISLRVSDGKSGLRRVWIGLLKDGKETILFEKEYRSMGVLEGGVTKDDSVRFILEPKKLKISDGAAVLRLGVWDYSWRKWWHGNHRYIEKQILIDTRPPGIEVISRAHNIRQGGSALAIYKLSEQCPEHGITVGDNFFPGYSGYFEDNSVCLAFFALSHLQGRGTQLRARAVDAAGNTTETGIYHYIRNKRFKKDRINISDNFLNWKMPELTAEMNMTDASMLARFLAVNRDMRQKNYLRVQQVCGKTEKKMLWQGAFGRLPKSATRATFADLRDYYYKKKVVDQQRHLGIDLASHANAEVPAANGGKVVFAGSIGIYGKTIVLDHGFGLFSMYSHLNHMAVSVDDEVTRGGMIGNTGVTGLAGGDHLHFGILIHNTLVDPIEWWDKNWIINNITGKLDLAAERFIRAE